MYNRSGTALEGALAGNGESARRPDTAAERQEAYAQRVSIATSDVSMYMRASCAKYSSSGDSATNAAPSSAAGRDSSFAPTAYVTGIRAMLARTENDRRAKTESPNAEIHTLRRMK